MQPRFGFLCLRAGDQPDNEAASSEGKGRALDMLSCSLAARDARALSTVALCSGQAFGCPWEEALCAAPCSRAPGRR